MERESLLKQGNTKVNLELLIVLATILFIWIPVPAARAHLPQGKPMGAENGPEIAFRESDRNLA